LKYFEQNLSKIIGVGGAGICFLTKRVDRRDIKLTGEREEAEIH